MGPAAVVPFLMTQRLPMLVQGQVAQLGSSGWPGLVELRLKGEPVVMNRRLVELTGLIVVLAIAVGVPVFVYNRHFVGLWVGAGRYWGDGLTLLSLVNGALLAVFSLWTLVLRGLGHLRILSRVAIAATAINVPASLLFTAWLGAPGPLLGTLASFVLTYLWLVPLILRRDSGLPVHDLAKAVAAPVLVGAVYAGAARWATAGHEPWGWPGLGAEMAAAGAGYLLLVWFILLDRVERRVWRSRFTPVFRPRTA
jgi:O-antigen/teichoic acid export membrane protein